MAFEAKVGYLKGFCAKVRNFASTKPSTAEGKSEFIVSVFGGDCSTLVGKDRPAARSS